jgi:hypothetical protein
MTAVMEGRAIRVPVPDQARAVGTAASAPSYEAAFRVDLRQSEPNRPPMYWIRATFEGAPRRWRWFLIAGWTLITCRLRLRSSTTVLGWDVEQDSADVAVIAVRAWVGLTSRIVTLVDDETVTLCSLVEFSGPLTPIARVKWAATIPLHERILPHLLAAASSRFQ